MYHCLLVFAFAFFKEVCPNQFLYFLFILWDRCEFILAFANNLVVGFTFAGSFCYQALKSIRVTYVTILIRLEGLIVILALETSMSIPF